VVPISFANTVILLAGVGILVTALGVGSAWLITAYDFPTRRILVWALLLPLAVPTYIVAFAYLDILHPIGPVQSLIREDRKSTRLNSSHVSISYAVFCLK